MSIKRYEGRQIEVTRDTERCLHAAECVHGLPAVFDTHKRPWVAPDEADPEALAAVIRRCQSANQPYCDRSGTCRGWSYQEGGGGEAP
jgi:uncharacterized Fe-S cluster protein YjdI